MCLRTTCACISQTYSHAAASTDADQCLAVERERDVDSQMYIVQCMYVYTVLCTIGTLIMSLKKTTFFFLRC